MLRYVVNWTLCMIFVILIVQILYTFGCIGGNDMGWEDLINSECKLVTYAKSVTDVFVVLEQRIVRETGILEYFGDTLINIQTGTTFFDYDAVMIESLDILVPQYPQLLNRGDEILSFESGAYVVRSLAYTYEHVETTDWVYSDPGVAYSGFFVPEASRFLVRTLIYKRRGLLDGFLGNVVPNPDYQQDVTVFGVPYGKSQKKIALSLLLWRFTQASDTSRTWLSTEPSIPFHAFENPPYEPDFSHLIPQPSSPPAVLYRAESFPGEVPVTYNGENPLSHPKYAAWCSSTTIPIGSGFRRDTIMSTPEGWSVPDGGGIEVVIRNKKVSKIDGGGVAIGAALTIPVVNLSLSVLDKQDK